MRGIFARIHPQSLEFGASANVSVGGWGRAAGKPPVNDELMVAEFWRIRLRPHIRTDRALAGYVQHRGPLKCGGINWRQRAAAVQRQLVCKKCLQVTDRLVHHVGLYQQQFTRPNKSQRSVCGARPGVERVHFFCAAPASPARRRPMISPGGLPRR